MFQVQQAQYTDQDTKRINKDKNDSLKLAKTLCIIFVTFVSCWTPYTIIAVTDYLIAFPLFVCIHIMNF